MSSRKMIQNFLSSLLKKCEMAIFSKFPFGYFFENPFFDINYSNSYSLYRMK